MSNKAKIAAIISTLLMAGGYAQAAVTDPITLSNNQVSIGLGAHDLEYHELDTTKVTKGKYLDSEDGTQPGVRIQFVGQSKAFGVSDMYLSVTGSYAKGHTDYDGYLQGGAELIPYKNRTDVTTTDLNLRVGRGYRFAPLPDFQATPFVGLGYQEWVRDMPGEYGYKETYKHNFGEVGVMLQYAVTEKLVIGADAAVGRTFSSKMDAPEFGNFKLGSDTRTAYGFNANYAISRHLNANIGVRMVDFKYGQSAVINGFMEPKSTSRVQELTVGVGYAF